MRRSLIASALLVLLATLAAPARATPPARTQARIKRPAMAVRRNFGAGFIKRARTIGRSRDGKLALVVAVDKHGALWNVELDLATGRNVSQLKHLEHYGRQEARFYSSDHLDRNMPHEFIRTQLGEPALTRSHKHLRVVLPGTELGVPRATVLVGLKKLFTGAGHWVSTDKNVRVERLEPQRLPAKK
ncbi:MAG: hypothetical protein KC503_16715 [Myxococcales bacterium]|nr:hypothetical protein [Myxococcales bacterium]